MPSDVPSNLAKGACTDPWHSSGMLHDLILEHCPELAPLADLHLSDINGLLKSLGSTE